MKGVSETGMKRSINRKKFVYETLIKELENAESQEAQIRKELEALIRIRKNCDAFDTHAEQTVCIPNSTPCAFKYLHFAVSKSKSSFNAEK